jgi:hypothetical protein
LHNTVDGRHDCVAQASLLFDRAGNASVVKMLVRMTMSMCVAALMS